VAVGEAQSLGLPLQYGGPYIGYMASKLSYVRKMPGRICGMTKDAEGKRAFVLTFQAREQHIRRDKANSNICSNQSLLALFVTIYMALMGKKGLYEAAQLSLDGAHYFYDKLTNLPYLEPAFDNQPFFKEFTLRSQKPVAQLQEALEKQGYLGPYNLSDCGLGDGSLISFAITEKRTPAEIDACVACLEGLV
jgi:glycine dehydrogenase subunit 1